MKATEFFVRRPVLFWSLMAAILIAGLLSFIQMPKLEDPAVAVKQAMVMVPLPGGQRPRGGAQGGADDGG